MFIKKPNYIVLMNKNVLFIDIDPTKLAVPEIPRTTGSGESTSVAARVVNSDASAARGVGGIAHADHGGAGRRATEVGQRGLGRGDARGHGRHGYVANLCVFTPGTPPRETERRS